MLLLTGIRDPEAKLPPWFHKFPKQSPWLKTRSSLTLVSWALLMEDELSQSRDFCLSAESVTWGRWNSAQSIWESQPGFLLSFTSQQPPPTLETD